MPTDDDLWGALFPRESNYQIIVVYMYSEKDGFHVKRIDLERYVYSQPSLEHK